MHASSRRRARPQAFTVVELLVAIALIVLLLAMLLPQLGKARDGAQQLICLSNMRQLGIATNSYQNDNEGFYPQPFENTSLSNDLGTKEAGKVVWFNALDAYLGDQSLNYKKGDIDDRNYRQFKQDPVWENFPEDKQDNWRSIKMNEHFGYSNVSGGNKWKFYLETEVLDPAKTLLFVDGRANDVRPDSTSDSSFSHFHASEGTVGLRHSDGANVGFADGHGEWVIQEIRYTTAAPSWFNEPDPLQTLTWQFSFD